MLIWSSCSLSPYSSMSGLEAALKEAGQAHLWDHLLTLDGEQRAAFQAQLEAIDFLRVQRIFQASVHAAADVEEDIEPITGVQTVQVGKVFKHVHPPGTWGPMSLRDGAAVRQATRVQRRGHHLLRPLVSPLDASRHLSSTEVPDWCSLAYPPPPAACRTPARSSVGSGMRSAWPP